jgi:hypothetical protein
MKFLIISIIIILILVLTTYILIKKPAWGRLDYWKAHLFEDPDTIWKRSSGIYDKEADLALRRTLDRLDRNNSTPEERMRDHHRAASILYHSVVAQPVHRTREQIAREDQLTVDQSQMRRAAFEYARHHWGQALENFRVIDLDAQPRPEFIIESILNFAENGTTVFVNGDIHAITTLLETFQLDQLVEQAETRRDETTEFRKETAQSIGGDTPGNVSKTYLDLTQRNTDDPENSHDVSVIAALRSIVSRLRAEQENIILPTLDNIAHAMVKDGNELSADPKTKKSRPLIVIDKVLPVIKRATEGEYNISLAATDEEILRRVWARSQDPRNEANSFKIRQAIFDALVDSWVPGMAGPQIACVNGRCSRILGALCLLDFDEQNWNVFRLEQITNDLIERAKQIIIDVAIENLQSSDSEICKAAKSYLATTKSELQVIGDIDEHKNEEFINIIRKKLISMIDDENLPPHAVAGIKKDILAAL